MATITATTIQDEFNTDLEAVIIEAIIDSAIDAVNSDAGTSISYMTGSAGSKTLTVTGNQAAALKPLVAMKLASRETEGASSESVSLGPASTSSSLSTSTNEINLMLYAKAIERLQGRSFNRA